MSRFSSAAAVIGCGLLLSVAACQRNERLEPVAGTVVFSDGQPVSGGVVEFDPLETGGRPARGAIGPDGAFTLKSGAMTGARAGRYRVAVVHVLVESGGRHGHAHRRVHPKFGRFATSGIVTEVTTGRTNAPRIVVEPAASLTKP
jgi:hypothetical protein